MSSSEPVVVVVLGIVTGAVVGADVSVSSSSPQAANIALAAIKPTTTAERIRLLW
ncbi:hypothetical protein NWFMUON74_44240 [Nocardia wallacei]|uniref:Uncharacterized protein n=1 Tax=Nocardia wallacei TaxID=480035 RepID=A0A7G1KN46_9NOCA|nr:hypothetical protein NWFMUON74_44240 [Nocardia wallacei]